MYFGSDVPGASLSIFLCTLAQMYFGSDVIWGQSSIPKSIFTVYSGSDVSGYMAPV